MKNYTYCIFKIQHSAVLEWIDIFCSVRRLGCHNRVNISSNKLLSTCTQLPAKGTEWVSEATVPSKR